MGKNNSRFCTKIGGFKMSLNYEQAVEKYEPTLGLEVHVDWLLELADNWPRICLGSSEQYWQVGSPP